MLRLALSLWLCLLALPLVAAEKPNVVLIVMDDLGQRDMGCYGSRYYKTPHIDALAKQSVRFTEAYAACPVCSPTRASIMTGRYPQRVNITDWIPGQPDRPIHKLSRPVINNELSLEAVTVAEAMKSAGYTTGLIGKWHLGGAGFEPQKQGFDVNIAGDQYGQPPMYFAPYKNKTRGLSGLENAPEGEYLTDRLTTEAISFITANKAKPFFLYLPHYAVHTPLQAKKDVIAKYAVGKPGSQGNPTYAAMVESMDDSIGRLMKTLDELKLSDNTLVIFTSDNGGLATLEGMAAAPTYNGPLREGKGYLYEGGVRVPLIIRGPGVTKPAVMDGPVCSIDLMPTILDLCGITPTTKLDGVSLKAMLGGSAAPKRDLYWHYPHYANQGSRPGGSVRSGDYKLIEFYENGRQELFNVKADIGENRNLIAEKPEIAKELATKLEAWRKDVGAKMPTPNPNYKPNPQAPNGNITIHSRTATVHGIMLRFEPLPHKNTLGFWVRADDYATFDFEVTKPGKFTVEIMQGCGNGSGGSEVEVSSGESKFTFKVKETGGFQAFENRDVGELTITKPGRHLLTFKPIKKPGAAVMDLRQVVLKPKS